MTMHKPEDDFRFLSPAVKVPSADKALGDRQVVVRLNPDRVASLAHALGRPDCKVIQLRNGKADVLAAPGRG